MFYILFYLVNKILFFFKLELIKKVGINSNRQTFWPFMNKSLFILTLILTTLGIISDTFKMLYFEILAGFEKQETT